MPQSVGFIGLGIMGQPMALNLVKAGFQVSVYNRTRDKAAPLEHAGARVAASPADAARGADFVMSITSDSAASEQIVLGKDGVIETIKPGAIMMDSATISPVVSRKLACHVAGKQASFLDAPVTGSKIGAEAGELLFIVGGPESTVAALDPLFMAMGKKVIRVGETGAGESAKIGMNLMIATMFEGFAEALALTGKLGVPADKLVELIESSMIRSGVLDYKAKFVLQEDWTPNFPLRLMLKDIRLMLEAAVPQAGTLPAPSEVVKGDPKADAAGHANEAFAATAGTVRTL